MIKQDTPQRWLDVYGSKRVRSERKFLIEKLVDLAISEDWNEDDALNYEIALKNLPVEELRSIRSVPYSHDVR